jgi:phosphoglycerate dehydrogenase-like enzyme
VDLLRVLVMAPVLGPDLGYVTDVDERVVALDGNRVFGSKRPEDQAEADRLLGQAEVVILGFPMPSRVRAGAPHLRWAHHTQAGVSNLHRSDLWDSDVRLTSSRGLVSTTAIAAYAVAGALHFARGMHEALLQQRQGTFTRDGYDLVMVSGATMGIIGLGGIGAEVARLSRALGMRVLATRRSVSQPQPLTGPGFNDDEDLVVPAGRILEVAAASDFLAVCAQLTSDTEGMINDEVFAAMKPGAVLINIARGEEVDEDALLRALEAGRIRGAVLDVYNGELRGRPPRPELAGHPKVVLTPHISGGGVRGDGDLGARRHLVSENLRRYLDGQPLINEVDRRRGY